MPLFQKGAPTNGPLIHYPDAPDTNTAFSFREGCSGITCAKEQKAGNPSFRVSRFLSRLKAVFGDDCALIFRYQSERRALGLQHEAHLHAG